MRYFACWAAAKFFLVQTGKQAALPAQGPVARAATLPWNAVGAITETIKTVAAAQHAKYRILVVDDHPLVCEGLADLINRQSDVACCGSAGDIPAAHQAVAAANPDLVVVDLRLGGADGLDLIKWLRAGGAGL